VIAVCTGLNFTTLFLYTRPGLARPVDRHLGPAQPGPFTSSKWI